MTASDLHRIYDALLTQRGDAILAYIPDANSSVGTIDRAVSAVMDLLNRFINQPTLSESLTLVELFHFALTDAVSMQAFNMLFSKKFPPRLRTELTPFLQSCSDISTLHTVLSTISIINQSMFINTCCGSLKPLFHNPIVQHQLAQGLLDAQLFLFAAAVNPTGQKCFEFLLSHAQCSAYGLNTAGRTLELEIALSSLDPALKAIRTEQVWRQRRQEDSAPTNYWDLNFKRLAEKASAAALELVEMEETLPVWEVATPPLDINQIKKFHQLLAWLEAHAPFSNAELIAQYREGLRLLSINKAFRTQALFPQILASTELFARALGDYQKRTGEPTAANEAELSAFILTGMEQLGYCAQGVVSYFTSATMALNSKMKLTHAINMAIDKKAPVLFRMLGIPETMQVHFGKDRLMRLMGINTTVDYDAYRVMLSKGLVQSFANKITSELILEDTLVTDSLPILDTPALILELTRGEQAIYLGQIRATLERDWLTLQRAGLCINPLASSDEQCREVLETITGLAPEAITDLLVHSDDTTYPKDAFNLKEQALLEGELEQKYRQVLREQEIYSHSPATVTALKEQIWSLLTKHPSLYEPSETKLWQQLIESPNGLYFFKATVEAHADEARVIRAENLTYRPPEAPRSILEALLSDPFMVQWFLGVQVQLTQGNLVSCATPSCLAHLFDDLFSAEHEGREQWLEWLQIQPGCLNFILCISATPYRSLFDEERIPFYQEMTEYITTNTSKKYDSLLPVIYDMTQSATLREAAQSLVASCCRKQKALHLWDAYWTTACYLKDASPEFLELHEVDQISSLLNPAHARAALFLYKNKAQLAEKIRDACAPLGAAALYEEIMSIVHRLDTPHAASEAAGAGASSTQASDSADGMALYWAAYHGDIAQITALAEDDLASHVGIGADKMTPTAIAALQGHYTAVQMLLDKGAQIPNCIKWFNTSAGKQLAVVFAELSKEKKYHARLLEHHATKDLLDLSYRFESLRTMLARLAANPINDEAFAHQEAIHHLVFCCWDDKTEANALLTRLLTNPCHELLFAHHSGVHFLTDRLSSADLMIKERALSVLATLVTIAGKELFKQIIDTAEKKVMAMLHTAEPSLKPLILCIIAHLSTEGYLSVFLHHSDALPSIIAMLHAEDKQRVRVAASTLATLLWNEPLQAAPCISAAIPRLIMLLHSEDGAVRYNASETLAALAGNKLRCMELIAAGAAVQLIDALEAKETRAQSQIMDALSSMLMLDKASAAMMVAHHLIPKLVILLKANPIKLRTGAAKVLAQIAAQPELREALSNTPRTIIRLRSLLEEDRLQTDAALALAYMQDDESFASRKGISNLVFLYHHEDHNVLAQPILARLIAVPANQTHFVSRAGIMVLFCLISAGDKNALRYLGFLFKHADSKTVLDASAEQLIPQLIKLLNEPDVESKALATELMPYYLSTPFSPNLHAIGQYSVVSKVAALVHHESPAIAASAMAFLHTLFTLDSQLLPKVIAEDGIIAPIVRLLPRADEALQNQIAGFLDFLNMRPEYQAHLLAADEHLLSKLIDLLNSNTSGTRTYVCSILNTLLIKRRCSSLLNPEIVSKLINHSVSTTVGLSIQLRDIIDCISEHPCYAPHFKSSEGVRVLLSGADFATRNNRAKMLIEFIKETPEHYPLFASQRAVKALSEAFFNKRNDDYAANLSTIILKLFAIPEHKEWFSVYDNRDAVEVLFAKGDASTRREALSILAGARAHHQFSPIDLIKFIPYLFAMVTDDLELLPSLELILDATSTMSLGFRTLPEQFRLSKLIALMNSPCATTKSYAELIVAKLLEDDIDFPSNFFSSSGIEALVHLLDNTRFREQAIKVLSSLLCSPKCIAGIVAAGGITKLVASLPLASGIGNAQIVDFLKQLKRYPASSTAWADEGTIEKLYELLTKDPVCALTLMVDTIEPQAALEKIIRYNNLIPQLFALFEDNEVPLMHKDTLALHLYRLAQLTPLVPELMIPWVMSGRMHASSGLSAADAAACGGAGGLIDATAPATLYIAIKRLMDADLLWLNLCAMCILPCLEAKKEEQPFFDSIRSKLHAISQGTTTPQEIKNAALAMLVTLSTKRDKPQAHRLGFFVTEEVDALNAAVRAQEPASHPHRSG